MRSRNLRLTTDLVLSCSTAYDRTRTLLTKHRADVEKVAKLLLEKEVITRYMLYLILEFHIAHSGFFLVRT